MAQFIIATHSPILLAYPGATLFSLDGGRVHEVRFSQTEHYRVTRDFLLDPDTHLAEIFERAEAPPPLPSREGQGDGEPEPQPS
jgi:hypothetical protein